MSKLVWESKNIFHNIYFGQNVSQRATLRYQVTDIFKAHVFEFMNADFQSIFSDRKYLPKFSAILKSHIKQTKLRARSTRVTFKNNILGNVPDLANLHRGRICIKTVLYVNSYKIFQDRRLFSISILNFFMK